MKNLSLAICLLMVITAVGCTKQSRAKSYGGSYEQQLPENQKLVNVTWKGEQANLWVLTRPMRSTEEAETYVFKEYSSLGILEGSVTLKEIKK
jgi:hypothetical protein